MAQKEKQIGVSISITGIENWNVNWENELDAKHELGTLKAEIRREISRYLGIHIQNIDVLSIGIV